MSLCYFAIKIKHFKFCRSLSKTLSQHQIDLYLYAAS